MANTNQDRVFTSINAVKSCYFPAEVKAEKWQQLNSPEAKASVVANKLMKRVGNRLRNGL